METLVEFIRGIGSVPGLDLFLALVLVFLILPAVNSLTVEIWTKKVIKALATKRGGGIVARIALWIASAGSHTRRRH